MSLYETYEPDFHARTIKSLDEDEHLQYLRTMVCLKIASVLPDKGNEFKQEMWRIANILESGRLLWVISLQKSSMF